MIAVSYESYRRLLKSIENKLGIDLGYTPHSPRAGFATDRFTEGRSFVDIREAGRWIADASLRTYLDVIASANISANFRTSGLSTAMAYSVSHLLEYLPGSENHQRSSDSKQ